MTVKQLILCGALFITKHSKNASDGCNPPLRTEQYEHIIIYPPSDTQINGKILPSSPILSSLTKNLLVKHSDSPCTFYVEQQKQFINTCIIHKNKPYINNMINF